MIGLGLFSSVNEQFYVMDRDPSFISKRIGWRRGLAVIEFIILNDITQHKRSIYTIMDILGDVGGLLDGLRLLGGFLMSAYTFMVGNPLNAFLVNRLFLRNKVSDNQSQSVY